MMCGGPFGFLPKISTTVENTVEKRDSSRSSLGKSTIFGRSARGESRRWPTDWPFPVIVAQLLTLSTRTA
jgi:hypothetical protein